MWTTRVPGLRCFRGGWHVCSGFVNSRFQRVSVTDMRRAHGFAPVSSSIFQQCRCMLGISVNARENDSSSQVLHFPVSRLSSACALHFISIRKATKDMFQVMQTSSDSSPHLQSRHKTCMGHDVILRTPPVSSVDGDNLAIFREQHVSRTKTPPISQSLRHVGLLGLLL